jgi:protein-disulfide isomerase
MKAIEETPLSIKLAYVLIVILFLISITNCFRIRKIQNSVGNKAMVSWVNDNAETIINSLNKYVVKQQEESRSQQQTKAEESIKKLGKELSDTKYAGVINPKGTTEIIEFFDYNCGYCKMSAKNIDELLKARQDVKVILRPIPILGEASNYATQVGTAILMMEPTKYHTFFNEIMSGTARDEKGVEKAVEASGFKMSKVKKFLEENKEKIASAIEVNVNLARQIGINGTPAFIVNGELIPGAVSTDVLKSKLN